jgi:hypothetical protein
MNGLRNWPLRRAVDGMLYAGNAVRLVEALDAATGKTLCVQESIAPGLAGLAGQSNRGVRPPVARITHFRTRAYL